MHGRLGQRRGVAGEWQGDQRHGEGACRFADGMRFRGRWRAGGWLQSAACPLHSRALVPPEDPLRAVAGSEVNFTIQVPPSFSPPTTPLPPPQSRVPLMRMHTAFW